MVIWHHSCRAYITYISYTLYIYITYSCDTIIVILHLYHLYHLYITYSCDTIVISQLLEVTAPPCTVLSSQLGSGTGWLFVGSIDRKMTQNRPRIEGNLPGNRGPKKAAASSRSYKSRLGPVGQSSLHESTNQ